MSHEFITPYEKLSHDDGLQGGSSISNQKHMKSKSIKVACSYQQRRDNNSVFGRIREIALPKLQIQGKWLDELGFHIGDRLIVEYEKGAIHIRSAEPEACMVCETADYKTSGTGVGGTAGIMDGGETDDGTRINSTIREIEP